jgi:ribosomal-protein-alanine N-acetyltransferase
MAHAAPLERFERSNRAFFASRIGDRGDDYFDRFTDRLAALVAENEAGTSLLYVVLDEEGEIVGRVNITDIDHPERTEIGFRVAEHAQGRGIATNGVMWALDQAAAHGVRLVHARASTVNLASQQVLQRCGFNETGPTEPPAGSTKPFVGYSKQLSL